jgi:hypothetical protein
MLGLCQLRIRIVEVHTLYGQKVSRKSVILRVYVCVCERDQTQQSTGERTLELFGQKVSMKNTIVHVCLCVCERETKCWLM